MAIQFDNTNTGVATLKPASSGTLTLTLPTADGTSGQAITTNGSGQLAFSTVGGGGGGLTGFTAAESTAAPNATVYVDSLTSSAASTDADVAFVAKGTGATLAQVPTSTTAGGNKRGTYATDFQKARTAATQVASGSSSVIAGGNNNVATNTYSIVVGGLDNNSSGQNSFIGGGGSVSDPSQGNKASGSFSVVVGGSSATASGSFSAVIGGDVNTASGNYAFVGSGNNNTASGFGSVIAGGIQNTANSIFSAAMAAYASTRSINANIVIGSRSPISTIVGTSQTAILVLAKQTTDATATVLRSDTSAASGTNQVTLPNNSAYYFRGECIAGVTGAGDTKGWYIEGVIKRGANAASTAIVGTATVTSLYADTGAATWAVTATADTTNGGLAITVTGAAATTIRWVCQIRTTEMTY